MTQEEINDLKKHMCDQCGNDTKIDTESKGQIKQINLSTAYDRIQLPGNRFRQYIETNANEYPVAKSLKSAIYFVDDILLTDQYRYKKHQYQRRALAYVTYNLERQGFNLVKHGNDNELRGINWNDLRKYHKLTARHVPKPGCTWCKRYNIRNKEPGWITSDLDNIDINPYGNNYYNGADNATYYNLNTLTGGKKLRKFQVPGTLEGHPITVYIDSGATISYIAP
ncbi:hypothetical protein M431DRAFT_488565 [Trichoderma harzianum CBS 226.95]|uniref:Uncharacterized protein n=1 Tax=Trichoderma harzianum CBS 226.95 TaxID=983964 RepID=A0A2T3ZRL0_TRIHA|nr:hypothetical protein M431DRAFT_488565 [Trichoderma harzianum CBS 226.95]PTB47447.1 hypothetical protein M431DRAFT_488565 [Trichoderma harzianum CBS 226.95]